MIMMNTIRSIVSENRKRYVDKNVNLDLSYITHNIIAMSYPAEGIEGYFRNPYTQVKKFLDDRHSGHYKVYNLRSEKQYDLSRFEKAANYPFLDHQAPPFSILADFCADASSWLNQDKNNVVAIHCKAGKGRTGTVIAALLLFTGEAADAKEAIEIYGRQRTENTKGITIPSQIRYVNYFDFMLKNPLLYELNKGIAISITQIVVHDLPFSLKNNKEFTLQIFNKADECIFHANSNTLDISRTLDTILIDTLSIPPLKEDFKVVFVNSKEKDLFSFWLNTTFVFLLTNNILKLRKEDIDLAFNDRSCKEFRKDFCVSLTFVKEK